MGISRSSGTCWRHGHAVVLKSGDIKKHPPISRQRPAVTSARFLAESERNTIVDPLHARRSVRDIARQLGRSPINRRQADPPQHSSTVRQLPFTDSRAQCRTQKERSPSQKNRRQFGAARLRGGTPLRTRFFLTMWPAASPSGWLRSTSAGSWSQHCN